MDSITHPLNTRAQYPKLKQWLAQLKELRQG